MIEPEVPLKRKDQIALDEQIARGIQAKLDVELLEEQKLARKQEEEASIALIESWETTQAMMEADRLLAKRLQSKEREELTNEEKAKLFMETDGRKEESIVLSIRAQEQEKKTSYQGTKIELKLEEEKESEEVKEDDEVELKKLLVIKKDEYIAIDAIPLATKLPMIIDNKLHKEGGDMQYTMSY
ncbi:hypothetical protein Tco_1406404 [Tanacetum coccineum]